MPRIAERGGADAWARDGGARRAAARGRGQTEPADRDHWASGIRREIIDGALIVIASSFFIDGLR